LIVPAAAVVAVGLEVDELNVLVGELDDDLDRGPFADRGDRDLAGASVGGAERGILRASG